VLVNNAGITGRKGANKTPVAQTEPADWDRVMETNVTAAFLLCRACLASMQRARWGRVINMASQAARARTERANAHYAASKAALIGFSRGLALEVAGDGITVNCIAPGRITTPMTTQTGPEVDAAYAARSAVGRVGTPADITAAALFLAAEENSFITGMTLDVNGGYSMN
jgi:3-oxoacyl-[acyl-carrier protein] reductase